MGVTTSTETVISASKTPPVSLTIAGTDSGGSAGVAADLKSFAAHRTHGVFAVTLVTAQNTTGIVAVEPMHADLIAAQIEALTAGFDVAATKTGLLFTVETIEIVATRRNTLGPLVVDPVLVSSAGRPIVGPEVVEAYVERLFPMATVITPNVAEASLLTGMPIETRKGALDAGAALLELGPEAVVITGLHDGNRAVDVFAMRDQIVALDHELVNTVNVLGTGCSLSASIAARLAHGDDIAQAVDEARRYVFDGLRGSAAWKLGAGHGPIDHFARWPGLR